MAPAAPCPDCAKGFIHDGTPQGKVTTLHSLPTYVSEPKGEVKAIIVMLSDAFGWELPNSRLLCDDFAERCSARVYLPDFFNGHAISHAVLDDMENVMDKSVPMYYKVFPVAKSVMGFVPFLFFNRASVTSPRVYGFFKALRDNEAANLPVGTAGYCWGGKYVTLLCQDREKSASGKSLIECGFTAHPSQLDVPTDIEPITLPYSVSIGDIDLALAVDKVKEMQAVLEKKADKERFEVTVLPGAKHGFAIRGNMKVEVEVEQMKSGTEQAVAWFDKWLKPRKESKL